VCYLNGGRAGQGSNTCSTAHDPLRPVRAIDERNCEKTPARSGDPFPQFSPGNNLREIWAGELAAKLGALCIVGYSGVDLARNT
jgi:hypothetical protein